MDILPGTDSHKPMCPHVGEDVMRNFAIAAAIVLTIATVAGWAQPTPTSGSTMAAASDEIDLFALQSKAGNLPAPVVQDLI
jgi:hypothetical protein